MSNLFNINLPGETSDWNEKIYVTLYIPEGIELDELKISDSIISKGTIVNDCGDIHFTSVDIVDIDLTDNLGDIDLSIKNSYSDLSYDIRTSLGDVKVNGEKRGSYAENTIDSSENEIKIVNNCGNISLDFED